MSCEEEVWSRYHDSESNNLATNDEQKTGVPKYLFTDNDPACTIKGCGFKNREVAIDTIRLSGQPGSRYKQYWTIRAMYERAKHHPSQTAGMQDAMVVFKEWLDNREVDHVDSEEYQGEIRKEKAQRLRLVSSFANAHSRTNCSSDKEFNDYAKSDRNDAVKSLKEAARTNNKKWFMFSVTSFVALFGGPGNHGYGQHVCTPGKNEVPSSFCCFCDPCYSGYHTIICDDISRLHNLGRRFPFKSF